MQAALRRGVTISVILFVLAPTTLIVASHTASVTGKADPLSYIPQNSTSILSINEGSNQLIIFKVASETGFVLKAHPRFFYNLISQHNLNFTSNITISKVSTTRNMPIYKISNVEPLSIVVNTSLRNAIDKLGGVNSSLKPSGSAIYFSNPKNNIFILGNLSAVRSSLSISVLQPQKDSFSSSINESAKVSFVLRPPLQGYVDQVTGNLTGNTLSIMITFSQSIYAADFFGLYLLSILGKDIVVTPINSHTDEIQVNLNSTQFLPMLSLLQATMGGFP